MCNDENLLEKQKRVTIDGYTLSEVRELIAVEIDEAHARVIGSRHNGFEMSTREEEAKVELMTVILKFLNRVV